MALEFIKPTYSPVKSVNGMTGDVVIEMPEVPEIDLTEYATEEYVDRKVLEVQAGDVNLDAYATKVYVDEAVAAIELTPGPKGEDGKTPVKDIDYFDGKDGVDGYTPIKGVDYFDGKDYVLTEEDKAEIAGMVDVSAPDVDLTDYYTKSETDEKIGELPVIEDEEGINLVNTVVDYVAVSIQQTSDRIDSVAAEFYDNVYTKSEINDLLANLPAGDLPSGEEVEF